MELLGDVGHVESRFSPFGDSVVLVQDRSTVCADRTMGLDWMHPMVLLGDEAQVEVVSVRLEIVLILKQDRCTVCAEHNIGSKNHFGRTRWNS
jgi:hypothetical protein